jgi:POT family proton-dependent oligopeptide transporter
LGFWFTVFISYRNSSLDDDDYKKLSSQQDKDRFVVLLLSFIMVIIFWGAFEQAGGLMNLYTDAKTDRMLLGWQVPTCFQSLNAGFIILLQLV